MIAGGQGRTSNLQRAQARCDCGMCHGCEMGDASGIEVQPQRVKFGTCVDQIDDVLVIDSRSSITAVV